jgi:hypothetical protein
MKAARTLQAAAALVLFAAATLAAAARPRTEAMPRVVVTAKRMSDTEKARFDEAERRQNEANARPAPVVVVRRAD